MTGTQRDGDDGGARAPSRVLVRGRGDVGTTVATLAAVAGRANEASLACLSSGASPAAWQAACRAADGWRPESVAVVRLDAASSETTIGDGSGAVTAAPSAAPERSVDCTDLVGMGRFVSARVNAHPAGSLVCCLDGVETLLDAHSRETVFEFLFVVGQRLTSAGGRFAAVVDGERVDEETLRVLAGAFEETLRAGDAAAAGSTAAE